MNYIPAIKEYLLEAGIHPGNIHRTDLWNLRISYGTNGRYVYITEKPDAIVQVRHPWTITRWYDIDLTDPDSLDKIVQVVAGFTKED